MSINTKKPVAVAIAPQAPRLVDRSIKNKSKLKKHQLAHQKKLQAEKQKAESFRKEKKAKKKEAKKKMKTPRVEYTLQPKVRAPMKPKKIQKSEASELKRHIFIFKTLTKSDKRTDIILKKAPLKLYKALRLLFKLLVKGAIPLKPTHRSKLKKWAPFIRQNSKGTHSQIKKRVSQNGEGLGDILKTVLPMIIPILSLMI